MGAAVWTRWWVLKIAPILGGSIRQPSFSSNTHLKGIALSATPPRQKIINFPFPGSPSQLSPEQQRRKADPKVVFTLPALERSP